MYFGKRPEKPRQIGCIGWASKIPRCKSRQRPCVTEEMRLTKNPITRRPVMHSAHRNTIEGSCLTVADTGPKPGSTKFPAARSLALASVVGLLLIAARPMGAQEEAVLYNFPGY